MPTLNRSEGRDVHIHDARSPDEVLGGLILTNGVTKANFHSMIEILFIFTSTFFLQHNGDTNTTVQRDNTPLQPGSYYIVTAGSISVNNEPWLVRTISLQSGTRTKAFCDAVRSRDRRCIITGDRAVRARRGNWAGFEAAHIFPLAYNAQWMEQNFSRWITMPSTNGESINSVQNGLLLRSDIHQLFDSYMISINPDDNYKVVFFDEDGSNLAGRHLDQEFLKDPARPVIQLLRWHFRQAVLANMRGVGEPIFEHDFPPGSDILGDIRGGPLGPQRMESELFGRMAPVQSE